jgi:hypothetical protein
MGNRENGTANLHEENKEQDEQGLELWHLLAPVQRGGTGAGGSTDTPTLGQRVWRAGRIGSELVRVRREHVLNCR